MKPFDTYINQSYFFDEGLCFECQECGDCCTGEPGIIFVSEDEVKKIAKHLKITPKAFIKKYCRPFESGYTILEHDDGRCLFYENGCQIYSVRPKQCQTFPFWFNNIRSKKAWLNVKKTCPGIDRGKLFTKEEILNKINYR